MIRVVEELHHRFAFSLLAKKMLGLCVLVILSCFSTIHASISDHHPHLGHMGNFEEEFSNRLGANFEYVYGNIWPKPQKEIKTNEYFTLDPENFE